jgi:hypothetical protein
MFGKLLLQTLLDGAAAFGRRGVATDPDDHATGPFNGTERVF